MGGRGGERGMMGRKGGMPFMLVLRLWNFIRSWWSN
jgi:hypothetical protein